jgi:hypothetical protein
MNKRCIVNVATGEFYCKMQNRLLLSTINCIDNIFINTFNLPEHSRSLFDKRRGIDLLLWQDCLPKGSRHHPESPYGFKVHAIKAAYEMGYTSILWVDSPAYAVKEDISPIFDKIEKDGYYAMSHIDPLDNWVGDTALMAYGFSRAMLNGLNLPSGSCYGFRIDGPMPEDWPLGDEPELFWDFYLQEVDGLFQSEAIGEGKWHRHDEAILALNLIKRGLPVFTFDPLFQSDSPECVIKSGR